MVKSKSKGKKDTAKEMSVKSKKTKEKNILKDGYPIAAAFTNNVGNLSRILFATIVLFLLALGGLYWTMSSKIDEVKSQVFVVKEGKAYAAQQLSDLEYRSIIHTAEVANHLKTFLYNMFAYNKVNFDDRVATAFELVSPQDGKVLFDALQGSKTKERLISTGQSTEVQIDSMKIDLVPGSDNVFKADVSYLVDTYYKGNNISEGHRITCSVLKTTRSVENPHGLLITGINYFPYEPKK